MNKSDASAQNYSCLIWMKVIFSHSGHQLIVTDDMSCIICNFLGGFCVFYQFGPKIGAHILFHTCPYCLK